MWLTSNRWFTLLAATFFGVAAYWSARTPLRELTPWLPILLTVYFCPKRRQAFNGGERSQLPFYMQEGRRFAHSSGLSVEPGSIQSDEDFRSQVQLPERWPSMDHETSHTGWVGQSASPHSGPSDHESDIELDSPARRASDQIGSNMQIFTADVGFQSQGMMDATGPSSQGNPPQEQSPRCSSPESVEGPSTLCVEVQSHS